MHKYLVFFISLALFSCDSKQVYDQYQSLSGYWSKNNTISFTIKEIDTTKKYNLFINVRNNNNYPYQNLFLITNMNFPKGKTITDTLEYEMANPDGSLKGSGFGKLKENKLWYKENISFPEKGEYTFSIRQAMRNREDQNAIDSLAGIIDIGFRIENTN
ncbi:gliding motility-associated lipoprotein GldH [Mesonia hippocampi]|uniref:Gliding motility-associated lipoprotein GldH n=1 Tax=Mesonia hippocampi TaxID=1628250 RepID=A0A840EGI5_9FLAO|nr:gliding motility lipoprotein GldH [Mesonia hippocampi]MBB4118362.1 gliding motility-associated lipoprotein GldH [Mesonia hippocampi]